MNSKLEELIQQRDKLLSEQAKVERSLRCAQSDRDEVLCRVDECIADVLAIRARCDRAKTAVYHAEREETAKSQTGAA